MSVSGFKSFDPQLLELVGDHKGEASDDSGSSTSSDSEFHGQDGDSDKTNGDVKKSRKDKKTKKKKKKKKASGKKGKKKDRKRNRHVVEDQVFFVDKVPVSGEAKRPRKRVRREERYVDWKIATGEEAVFVGREKSDDEQSLASENDARKEISALKRQLEHDPEDEGAWLKFLDLQKPIETGPKAIDAFYERLAGVYDDAVAKCESSERLTFKRLEVRQRVARTSETRTMLFGEWLLCLEKFPNSQAVFASFVRNVVWNTSEGQKSTSCFTNLCGMVKSLNAAFDIYKKHKSELLMVLCLSELCRLYQLVGRERLGDGIFRAVYDFNKDKAEMEKYFIGGGEAKLLDNFGKYLSETSKIGKWLNWNKPELVSDSDVLKLAVLTENLKTETVIEEKEPILEDKIRKPTFPEQQQESFEGNPYVKILKQLARDKQRARELKKPQDAQKAKALSFDFGKDLLLQFLKREREENAKTEDRTTLLEEVKPFLVHLESSTARLALKREYLQFHGLKLDKTCDAFDKERDLGDIFQDVAVNVLEFTNLFFLDTIPTSVIQSTWQRTKVRDILFDSYEDFMDLLVSFEIKLAIHSHGTFAGVRVAADWLLRNVANPRSIAVYHVLISNLLEYNTNSNNQFDIRTSFDEVVKKYNLCEKVVKWPIRLLAELLKESPTKIHEKEDWDCNDGLEFHKIRVFSLELSLWRQGRNISLRKPLLNALEDGLASYPNYVPFLQRFRHYCSELSFVELYGRQRFKANLASILLGHQLIDHVNMRRVVMSDADEKIDFNSAALENLFCDWGKKDMFYPRPRNVYDKALRKFTRSAGVVKDVQKLLVDFLEANGTQNPFIWELLIRLQLLCGKVNKVQNTFCKAMAACPFDKALWMSLLEMLRPFTAFDEENQFEREQFDAMGAFGIHLNQET